MEESRKILIVTDDDAAVLRLARAIAEVAPSLGGYAVSVLVADEFYGTDILPAGAFFLGCAKASPESFDYIEILFARLNLAGRPAGLFSPDSGAIRYLSGVVRSSEAAVGEPLLAKNGETDPRELREWVGKILETVEDGR